MVSNMLLQHFWEAPYKPKRLIAGEDPTAYVILALWAVNAWSVNCLPGQQGWKLQKNSAFPIKKIYLSTIIFACPRLDQTYRLVKISKI